MSIYLGRSYCENIYDKKITIQLTREGLAPITKQHVHVHVDNVLFPSQNAVSTQYICMHQNDQT